MRYFLGMMMLLLCMNGCSEMRIIGVAAIRELRADAVSVNWQKSESGEVTLEQGSSRVEYVAAVRERTFSSFRHSHLSMNRPLKGLWEQRGARKGI